MRIISKFYDYYDSSAGYQVDEDLMYIRKTRVVGTADVAPRWYNIHSMVDSGAVYKEQYRTKDRSADFYLYQQCVILAGKPYTYYVLEKRETRRDPEFGWNTFSEIHTFNTLTEARDFLEKNGCPRERGLSYYFDDSTTLEDNIKKYDWNKVHQDSRSPVLSLRAPTYQESRALESLDQFMIEADPNLSEIHFQSIVDPWTVHQEISMYLGGVLSTTGAEMVQLNDRELRQKHGFDKWSFRKMPTKRR